MKFSIKYFYIFLFVIVFLLASISDYLLNADWNLIENLFYAFWIVIFLVMIRLLLKSKRKQ